MALLRDENEIISAVCLHLESTGFSITQRLHTRGGYDEPTEYAILVFRRDRNE